ncbi:TSUP family transporter [Bacillus aerolatus]|uniref:Probable membrane transporter protein n=1 Tax=Bacillus aerolatus TaxID=2653354 RepID=A0A6I1FQ30_9BACI|nr:sulfite exporter TauE/SafE family protein [Bacillus aerolatus]KAB7706480.1 TSUP family transporter [Bacillus aerolatus]
MDWSIGWMATVFLIGFAGSFLSGMVGVGGAIINYPLLLYIPPLLGFAAFSAHEVAGISAVQVFFATIAGVWAYRKSDYLNKTLIVYMGAAALAGSFIGGFGSENMTESTVNVVYGLLAALAAVMMFVPKESLDNRLMEDVTFNKWLAVTLSFIAGIGAGVVGAGGAFLLVPIMLVMLKIPTRMTIASSLAITVLSSIGSAGGKLLTGQVLFMPALIVIIASLIASPLGAKAGQKVNTKLLQWLLAVLIAATAIKIWIDIIL